MNKVRKIRPKERDAIILSLKAGVTPRLGLHHIQVGRTNEISGLIQDIDRIADGGSAFRLIIGEYGSGKTFFLYLVRTIALEKGLVTVNADLSPDRRLYSTTGHARNLYAELMHNLSTRTKPEGNALSSVVERFIAAAVQEAEAHNNNVESVIHQRLLRMSDFVGGYDFAKVITAYWQGHENDSTQVQADSIRWLHGEFSTKTEARQALGVRSIVNDSNVYDHLKLMGMFVQLAGYKGLLVNLDEMVHLYKLGNTRSRLSNFEQILSILNDCLQGTAHSIGFVLAGTPEFLLDTRKGLFSYEALQSRLSENFFAKKAGVVDYNATTLHLANMSPEDIYVLLTKIRDVFAKGDESEYLLPDEALKGFMSHCSQVIGDAYFRTPRNTIRAFVDLLSVLEQNPRLKWRDLIEGIDVAADRNSDMPDIIAAKDDNVGELRNFKL
jgi:hypothetical protein